MRRRTFCKTTLSAGIAAALPSSGLFAQLNSMVAVPPEIQALTSDGAELPVEPAAALELQQSLNGTLLFPGNDAYDAARVIWNGMFDRHPAMIVMCADSADVAKAVSFAAERQMLVAVRGGGHSLPGKSVCDKGMMINLAGMNAVSVDVDARTANVQGGALLGQLDGASLAQNLVTTAGVVSHTGVGGFTLGGGMGRTDRIFGLAVDNLLGATMVTADGQIRRLGPGQDADLFWAIRGGGGNFGVVTEFVYRLHPFDPMVYTGSAMYSWPQVKDVLSHWAESGESMSDALSVEPSLFVDPEGQRMVSVEFCYSGDHAAGEKEVEKFITAVKPVSTDLGVKSYQAVQTAFDAVYSHGRLDYLKSGFFPELTQGAIDAIAEAYGGENLPVCWTQHLGGATARVDPQATAFVHRKVHSNFGIDANWADPAETEARIAKVREIYAAVAPHMSGFYINLNDDTRSKTHANFGQNYTRLVRIKTEYDPTNLFRLNANIEPAEESA